MKNGPVQSVIIVYSDFLHYSKGIYKYMSGIQEDLQAVKLIGWGVENGTKYWLIANCWNSDWGEDGEIMASVTTANLLV
ncbi:hypothetical protein OESDEN_11646 [Oesophagostomum dentatum]|uniref:Peptidase C1A papain C-terminal domain-containing protein n=1 Tax=Oesophagostomum dentatum TaxID=61180 RepID=A0A0B1STC1_OESDE|nr:hypothetical protein OESDEN_11646 [Oesophagostomum dentatum]